MGLIQCFQRLCVWRVRRIFFCQLDGVRSL